jgi:hypothetical protein
MSANPTTTRPCERYCPKCGQWKHHSRFRAFRRRRATSIDVAVTFARLCKDCEQIERNEKKNADRPLAIMRNRTASHAHNLNVSTEFLWVNMNWRALVPVLRAMLSPEGRCLSCGHPFVNERDVQIEHRYAPRHPQDWARQHARNLSLDCQSCNNGKGSTPYGQWLDDAEDARQANEQHRASPESLAGMGVAVQLALEI